MYTLEAQVQEEQIQDLNRREKTNDDKNLDGRIPEEKKPRYKNIVHLWEFLLELLADESCRSLITWSRESHGEFKLKNQEEVAKRWGEFKHRPNMNYEKLSRALRHYYNQGIIKKVPGQRLVYKFHKLPYEYVPRKTGAKSNVLKSSTATRQEVEYCSNKSSVGEKRGWDDSERPLTNRERMRRMLQERMNVTSNLDKPTNPLQNEEVPEVPLCPDSLECPSVPSLTYSRPLISIPVHPAACWCSYSFRDVKRLCCPSRIVYPVSADENLRSYAGWNYYHMNSVPVSVITSRYNQ